MKKIFLITTICLLVGVTFFVLNKPFTYPIGNFEPITFTTYDNEMRNLPPLPTLKEWSKVLITKGAQADQIQRDVTEHGEIMKRYYTKYEDIIFDLVEADVTADGTPEKIVSFDGGGTYGIIKREIIQDGQIIATIEPNSVGRSGSIQPHSDGNGFAVFWYTEDMFPSGFCCPTQQKITIFKYGANTFTPVSEETVLLD